MKKQKKRNIKLGLIVLVVSVVIALVFFYDGQQTGVYADDIATADYWTVGNVQPLSTTYSYILCSSHMSLNYKANGQWLQITNQDILNRIVFSPETASLTKEGSSADVTDLQFVNIIVCDFPDWIISIEVSGTESYKINSLVGTTKQLLSKLKTVPNTVMDSNKSYITSIYQFDTEDVEAGLVVNTNTGKVTLGAIVTHNLKFVVNTPVGAIEDNTIHKNFLTLATGKFLKQDDFIPPPSGEPPVATGHLPMELSSIQKVFSCNFSSSCSGVELLGSNLCTASGNVISCTPTSSGVIDTSLIVQQLQIKGIMHDYDTRESPPQIKIYQPLNSIQYGNSLTMVFDKWSGDDAIFKAIVYMPHNADNGVWTVEMVHDQRSTSTRTFGVLNSITDNNPIDNPISPDTFKTNVAIGYSHVFAPLINGIEQTSVLDTGCLGTCNNVNPVLNIPQLDIFNAIQFTNSCEYRPHDSQTTLFVCGTDLVEGATLETGQAKLREIRLYPLLFPATPEDAFTILHVADSSGLKADVNVVVGGQTKYIGEFNIISSPLSSASAIQCGATDISGSVDATKCLAFTRGISLGRALIPVDSDISGKGIELKLIGLGLKGDQYNIIVKADITGNFKLKTKDGVIFADDIIPLSYAWEFIWKNPFGDGSEGGGGGQCNSSDNSGCIDECPDGTVAVVNPITRKIVCDDGTCDFLSNCGTPVIDTDGDGFTDKNDSCPTVYSLTNNGCPENIEPKDTDGDGFPDVKDNCPTLYSLTNEGCPDNHPFVDTDGDGIPDHVDECPNVHGLDGKGCPVKKPECLDDEVLEEGICIKKSSIIDIVYDNDGDTIPNSIDQCPNTPKGKEVDTRGCATNEEPPTKCGEGTKFIPLTNKCEIDKPKGGAGGNDELCFEILSGLPIDCPFGLDDSTVILLSIVGLGAGIGGYIWVKRR